MNTRITDLALLGSSTMAGFSGLVEHYGGFAIAAGSAALLGIIRWQQHKVKMRHMEELHQAHLAQINRQ